jgi:site-specific recombinase XerD
MSVFDSVLTTQVVVRAGRPLLDPAQLAAVAFLARYRGRTLDSYRADLRQYFNWFDSVGVPPLAATRTHIELYRASMEARGLAASTIDRRPSTVCGYYRFAHFDGRSRPTQPSTYADPPSNPQRSEASIAANWQRSCTPPSESHRSMPRWPCCWG